MSRSIGVHPPAGAGTASLGRTHELRSEVARLKEQPGKNLALFSNNLAASLAQKRLIDEYRFFVNPVVLGAGTPVLKGIKDRAKLRLLKTEVLSSGVVILYYEPA